MNFKKLFLLIIPLALCLLTGCTGEQLNQKLIIKGIAIDYEKGDYSLTVQALDFQNPKNKDEPSLKVVEVRGASIVESLNDIKKQSGLTPLYSQNLVVIIGEELAQKGVNDFMDFFIRHFEARPKVKIAIAYGKAADFLTFMPNEKDGKIMSAKDVSDIAPDALNSDVMQFTGSLKSDISSAYAAYLKVSHEEDKPKIVMGGVAVFKDDVLAGVLTEDEFLAFAFMKGIPKAGSLLVETTQIGNVTCSIEKVAPDVKVAIKNNKPSFSINLSVSSDVFELDKNFYTHENEEAKKLIQEKLQEQIAEMCKITLSKLKKFGCDVLNFGKILRNTNLDYFRQNKSSLQNIFSIAEFDIKIKANVVITGKEPV